MVPGLYQCGDVKDRIFTADIIAAGKYYIYTESVRYKKTKNLYLQVLNLFKFKILKIALKLFIITKNNFRVTECPKLCNIV